MKSLSMFAVVHLLIALFTSFLFAQAPPHPRLLEKIRNGEIEKPYALKNIEKIRGGGVDKPWTSPQLRRMNESLPNKAPQRMLGPSRSPSGSWKALMILVQFSDKPKQVVATSFDNMIFNNSPGTLRDYYRHVSYNTLDIVTVNLPSSIGWVNAPQPYSYYVNGQNGFGSYPQNAQKLVEDVIALADPVVDFSQYDNNGDGTVDALYIVHTGPGAEFTGNNNDIWSHAWVTSTPMSYDGVTVYHYSMEPEYWLTPGDMTIGVYAHELGHAAFGLPDLYDVDYSSEGLGDWSIMAGGSWNGPTQMGESPSYPDAWCRIQMGFVSPTVVPANVISQAVPEVEDNAAIFKLWKNGSPASQYFLVENRQLTSYDQSLPNGGLLIYHVDESVVDDNRDEWYPGHTSSGHYLVALEQADGLFDLEHNHNRGDAGDPWPGSTNNVSFSNFSIPDSKDYTLSPTWVAVKNITVSSSIMHADLQVVPTDSLLTLVAPNGGEQWGVGLTKNITWTNELIDNVKIEYTPDNGTTWTQIIASTPAATGSFAWIIPNTPSTQAKVRISSTANPSLSDVSDGTFTIYLTSTITVTPDSFSVTLAKGDSTTRTMTVGNTGQGDLTWNIGGAASPLHLQKYSDTYSHFPKPQGLADLGRAPAARMLAKSIVNQKSNPLLSIPSGSIAYTTAYPQKQFASFSLSAPGVIRTIAGISISDDILCGGFADNAKFYGITFSDHVLVSIDTASGAIVSIGTATPLTGEAITGFAFDWTTQTMYATSTSISRSTLYTIDKSTGTATVIGEITSAPGIIAIAVNQTGQMYGVDIVNDALYSINKQSGAGTLIGPLGFNANFAQGAAFDPATNQLFLAAFNIGTNQGELRVADLTTGATELIGPFQDGAECCAFGIAGTPSGFISTTPTSGTVTPGGTQDVTVKFTTASLHSGDTRSSIVIQNNDPLHNPKIVPVHLTVNGISLIAPNGGEIWRVGRVKQITWASAGIASVKIEYTTDNGTTWNTISASVPASNATLSWTVPAVTSTQCFIRVSDASNPAMFDVSDNPFMITLAPTAETEPNNTAATANTIEYGDSLAAAIDPTGDIDYYKFTAAAGDTIEIYTADRGTSTLNGMIRLFNASGNELGMSQNYTSWMNQKIIYAIPSAGTYIIRYSYGNNWGSFPNGTSRRDAVQKYTNTLTKTNPSLSSSDAGEYYIKLKKFTPAAPVLYAFGYNYMDYNAIDLWVGLFPNGLATTVIVDYGTTTTYGSSVNLTGSPVNSLGQYSLSYLITSLQPNTQYHFRVTLSNSAGTTVSGDMTLTTPPSPDGFVFQSSGTSTWLYGVSFTDANNGWAIGDGGTIVRTTNGGTAWTQQTTGTVTWLAGVNFIDANNGWVVGGTILRTTNGGSTWTQQTSGTNNGLYGVSFTDANNGWAVGGSGTIVRTTNGGATWTQQASGTGNFLEAVSFTDANNGWIVGDGGTILRTTNGGTTWTQQASGTTISLTGVNFTDANNGCAVGGGGIILRTTNGGTTWTQQTSGKNSWLNAVSFTDANNGCAVGDGGTILRTTNGGTTWTQQNGGTYDYLGGVSYKNNSITIVGGYGKILRSAQFLRVVSPNGGEVWVTGSARQLIWTSSEIASVKIEYTTDNGTNWNTISASVPASNGTLSWIVPAVASTQCFISVSDASNPAMFDESDNPFTIALTAPTTETEPNNTAATANTIEYGDSLAAAINPTGDVDYYKFTASAGDTVEIYTADRGSSSLYGMLQLYNGTGNQLRNDYSYSSWMNQKIAYAIPSTGTYFVRYSYQGNWGSFPNGVPGRDSVQKYTNILRATIPSLSSSDAGEYYIRLKKFTPAAPVLYSFGYNYMDYNAIDLWVDFYPNGLATTVLVDYGTTTTYGSSINLTGSPLNSLSDYGLSYLITSLQPNTVYHFRVTLSNSAGTIVSGDMTLTTQPLPDGFVFQNSGTSNWLFNVSFTDANNGWVVGDGSTIERTTNGGTTWTQQSTGTGIWLNPVTFTDANNGWAVGGTIVRTTNGGSTWIQQTSGTGSGLYGVSFTDVNNGWAVGGSGTIVRTTNGGATWTQQTSGTGNWLNCVSFTDVNNGWAVGDGGTILRTTNGGSAWTQQTSGTSNSLSGVSFVDANNGWAVGSTIIRTTNGGATWTQQTSGSGYYLRGVSFADADNGCAVGEGGTILRTTNGGTTWTQQISGTTDVLQGVSCKNNNITIVGGYGKILRSTNYLKVISPNGGEQWTAGRTKQVSWTGSGITSVKIEYTTDNETNWNTISANTPASNDTLSWTIPAVASTQCFIRVSDASNPAMFDVSDNPFTIRLTTPTTETEPNNTAATANAIEFGDSLAAAIDPTGDVDYYKFSASAGDTVEIYTADRGSSTIDGMIRLFNASGNELGWNQNYTSWMNQKIAYPIPSAGTYYVRYSYTDNWGSFPNGSPRNDSTKKYTNILNMLKSSPMLSSSDAGEYYIKLKKFTPTAPVLSTFGYNYMDYNAIDLWVGLYPNGLPTTAIVEYGTTTTYGSSVNLTGDPVNTLGQYNLSYLLTSLQANTVYHFRVTLTNSAGVTASGDMSLMTPAVPDGFVFQASGTGNDLYTVSFADANNGCAVGYGYGGTIVRTTNGGTTWTQQTSGVTSWLSLEGVSFIDANNGWAVGGSGTIVRTTNGGTTWNQQTSGTGNYLICVSFTDVNNGWAVGSGGTIVRTTNGGATWTQQTSGTGNWLNCVSFADANNGWAVGDGGTILRTTDGGATWTQQTGGTGNSLSGVNFIDANNGWAVGSTIIRTTNGGATWTQQTNGTGNYLRGVSFTDANNGCAVGYGGTVLRTTDGGTTWTQQTSGTTDGLQGVSYKNNNITIVGWYGKILRSTQLLKVESPNGGVIWVTGSLRQIRWTSSGIVSVKIEYTADNGANWNTISASTPASDDTLSWTVPAVASNQCFIRVSDASNPGTFDVSDNPFTITLTTPIKEVVTIPQLQTVPIDSLLALDALQADVLGAGKDNSPYWHGADAYADTVQITGVVLVKPRILRYTLARYNIYVQDTATGQLWSGIDVLTNDTSNRAQLTGITTLDTGMVVTLTGRVTEFGTQNNSLTELFIYKAGFYTGQPDGIVPVSVGGVIPRPAPKEITLDVLSTKGGSGGSGGTPKPSGGEKYESMYVIVRNVTVISVDSASGRFAFEDSSGYTGYMFDGSGYFTYRSHAIAGSGYSLPPLGSLLNFIRGVVVPQPRAGTCGDYTIMPMYPGDMSVGRIGPVISPPQNLVATAGNGQVTLKWNKNTEVDFLKYRIYRGTASGAEILSDSSSNSISDVTKIITGLANGTMYYFRITAVTNSWIESGYSNEVSATPNQSVLPGEVAFAPGPAIPIPNAGSNGGFIWGDVNGDGVPDVLFRQNNVMINGLTSFSQLTTAGLPAGADACGLGFADFNGDGLLDVFEPMENNLSSMTTTIWLNNGGTSFTQMTNTGDLASAGSNSFYFGGVAAADINHSGYLSLAWPGQPSTGALPGNNNPTAPGGGIWLLKGGLNGFTNIGNGSTAANLAIDTSLTYEAWNVSFFDANNDSYPDLLMPSFRGGFSAIDTGSGGSRKGTILFLNDKTGKFYIPTAATLGRTIYSIGAGGVVSTIADIGIIVDDTVRHFEALAHIFGDFNNDGIADLLCASNSATNRDGNGNFVRVVILYGKGDGTFTYKWNGINIVAYDGLPDVYIRAWNGGDYNNDGLLDIVTSDGTYTLFRNMGDGTFTNVTSTDNLYGVPLGYRSAAFVDYNNDGFLDIYSYTGGTSTLLKNNGNTNHWIGFKPVGTGNNKSAIGALIKVYSGSKMQVRQICAEADAKGFGGDLWANFGLGTATNVDSTVVRWPDGKVGVWKNLLVDCYNTIREDTVVHPPLTGPANVIATIVNGHALLEWSSLPGAVGYNVYRGTQYNFIADAAGGSNRIARNIRDEDPATPGIQWTDPSTTVVGDTTKNYFWRVSGLCTSDISRLPRQSSQTSKISGGTNHTVTGKLYNADNSVPGNSDIQFDAYIVSRPGEVLNEATIGCGYNSGYWFVNTGNLPTAWRISDTLHVDVRNVANSQSGTLNVVLTGNDPDLAPDLILKTVVESDMSKVAGVIAYSLRSTPGTDINEIVVGMDTRATRNPIWNAEDLINAIPHCTVVYSWNAQGQGFIGHPKGLPFNLFSVYPGYPYSVNVPVDTTWTVAGSLPDTNFHLITTPGTDINHIGVPFTKSNLLNADSLVRDIPGGSVVYVWSAVSQGTIGHPKGLPFNNFSVHPGYPYYVSVTCDSTWPSAPWAVSTSLASRNLVKKTLSENVHYGSILSKKGASNNPVKTGSSVTPMLKTSTTSSNLSGGVPHMVYGKYKGRISHGLKMQAWIAGRLDEVLNETVVGTGCDSVYWWLNVGTLPTPWKAGEKLEVELEDSTNKLGGIASITMTNDGADVAEVILIDKSIQTLNVESDAAEIPKEYSLVGNYPNPFNPATTIVYRLPVRAGVTLEIFDMLGRTIKMLYNGTQNPGEYSQSWDGTDNSGVKVSSGIYFYKMHSNSYTCVKKMILLK